MDSNGSACISEYGLKIVLRDEGCTKLIPINVRWVAPEVLDADNRCVPSGDDGKVDDNHSLATVIFEVRLSCIHPIIESASHYRTQFLTGITPLSHESGDEIVDRAATGFGSGWSLVNPPQGLGDALWACPDQQLEERPTPSKVLEILLALGEAYPYHHEPIASVDDPDDKAMISEWEYVEADLEEGTLLGLPPHEEHSAHHSLSNIFGGTFASRIGKYVRSFLRPQGRATAEAPGRREPVEKPKLGTEIIDRREDEVTVCDDRVAYLVSLPIPEGRTLRRVVITIVSKSQGRPVLPSDRGACRNSWTWFELSVGPLKGSERWCGEVVRNLHAHDHFEERTIEILDEELYEKAKSGDVLTVWALAKRSGWKNTVKKVMIRYVVQ